MNDTRRAVLERLADGPVPGPDLADELGVSRNAVWKHAEAVGEFRTGDGTVREGVEDGPARVVHARE